MDQKQLLKAVETPPEVKQYKQNELFLQAENYRLVFMKHDHASFDGILTNEDIDALLSWSQFANMLRGLPLLGWNRQSDSGNMTEDEPIFFWFMSLADAFFAHVAAYSGKPSPSLKDTIINMNVYLAFLQNECIKQMNNYKQRLSLVANSNDEVVKTITQDTEDVAKQLEVIKKKAEEASETIDTMLKQLVPLQWPPLHKRSSVVEIRTLALDHLMLLSDLTENLKNKQKLFGNLPSYIKDIVPAKNEPDTPTQSSQLYNIIAKSVRWAQDNGIFAMLGGAAGALYSGGLGYGMGASTGQLLGAAAVMGLDGYETASKYSTIKKGTVLEKLNKVIADPRGGGYTNPAFQNLRYAYADFMNKKAALPDPAQAGQPPQGKLVSESFDWQHFHDKWFDKAQSIATLPNQHNDKVRIQIEMLNWLYENNFARFTDNVLYYYIEPLFPALPMQTMSQFLRDNTARKEIKKLYFQTYRIHLQEKQNTRNARTYDDDQNDVMDTMDDVARDMEREGGRRRQRQ